MHEGDKSVWFAFASSRTRWKQPYDVATVRPEQQLHVATPSLHATSSEGERKCVVTSRLCEWQEGKETVRTAFVRMILGHVHAPCVILKLMLVSTCSFVDGWSSCTTPTSNKVTIFGPATATEIVVALKFGKITSPFPSFLATFGSALLCKASSSWSGTW